jgi:two-component system, OmpR family, response regulator
MSDPPHVLVVDDQADICELIRDALEEQGYRVSSAVNGRTAQKLLQGEPVDLAVIDALLPHGVSGRKLAEDAAAAGVPIIMITGSLIISDELAGAPFPVLVKPFRISQLVALIRDLFAAKG